jgi:hypothetical protein
MLPISRFSRSVVIGNLIPVVEPGFADIVRDHGNVADQPSLAQRRKRMGARGQAPVVKGEADGGDGFACVCRVAGPSRHVFSLSVLHVLVEADRAPTSQVFRCQGALFP